MGAVMSRVDARPGGLSGVVGDLEWQNSQLMDAPLEEFVTALKQTEGGEISVMASISLVRQLLFAHPAQPAELPGNQRGQHHPESRAPLRLGL
jgi:hypothetical protein